MKTKEEIIAVLKNVEGGEEFVTGFNNLLKDANNNTKLVKELTAKVSDLTADKETLTGNYNKLFDFIGLPLDTSNLDEALEEIKKKQQKNDKSTADIATLKSQLNEMKRNYKTLSDKSAEFEKQASTEKTKRQGMIKEMALRTALEANKALNPAITSRLMMGNIKVLDDDSVIYVEDDGSEVTVDEGVKAFLTKYPDYRANRQISGAGGGFNGSSGGNVDYETLSPAEYRKARAEGKII